MELTRQQHAYRLLRARWWHLFQAGQARIRRDQEAAAWDAEAKAHEGEAERLDREIRALGFDPQPPMGPRAA